MKETLNSKLYILVVIGIVSAFGPFVTCQPFRCWPDILILRHRSYSLA